MKHSVTLIPGDGVGPEIVEAVKLVVKAGGADIEWEEVQAGEIALKEFGTPLPEAVLESVRKNKVALKGPITTPIGSGFRSVNVALRHELGLYACLRPCKSMAGLNVPYKNIDIVVVRENSEDLYAGIEFDRGTKEANDIIALGKGKIQPNSAISIKPISEAASKRIVKFAFEYALANNRKKVTAVAKANIMKFTDGLFYQSAREVAEEYKDKIIYEERLVDALCMQLVMRPDEFDVLVLPNLYGDIISDLCAGLVGGLGVAPGANFGDDTALFEAVHGSAPKYAGQNKVNPTAVLLSAVLMLRYLGEKSAADKIELATKAVIAEGKSVTYDMKPTRNDPTAVGTHEMAVAIAEKIALL